VSRLGAGLRWLLLVAPCRFYLAGEENGGRVVRGFLLAMLAAAVACGGVGVLVAVGRDADVADWFATGLLVGLTAVTAWAVYALVVLAVLWLVGRPPDAVVSGDTTKSRYTGRRGAPGSVTWRRRGRDPLVPGSLVAFFALITALIGVDALWMRQSEEPFTAAKSVTDARVLRYDDGMFGFGERTLVVRFTAAGRTVTAEVAAEDVVGEVPEPGGELAVEYLRSDPERARPAGATEEKADGVSFGFRLVGVCAALLVVSAAAYVVGIRRRRTRG
jgi:hypothetical protein